MYHSDDKPFDRVGALRRIRTALHRSCPTDRPVDAPLVTAPRLTPIPVLSGLKAGVSWEVFA